MERNKEPKQTTKKQTTNKKQGREAVYVYHTQDEKK